MQRNADVVDSSLVAVLPGVALRGTVLGTVFAGFVAVYLFVLWEWTGNVLAPVSGFRAPLVVAVLPATLVVVVALAAVEYSRRRYELGEEELVEYRGILWTRSNSLPYDEITDVHLSQSTLQKRFGVGTIRINEQDAAETGANEAMRLRFVERPEAVYERLRAGPEDSLPRLTVQPDPRAAARTSAARGLLLAPLFGFVPVVVLASALEGAGVSTGQGLLVGAGAVLALVVARAGHIYSVYDQRQYDIYADRIEAVGDGSTTAAAFEDVDDVVVYDSLGRLGYAGDGTSLESDTGTAADGSGRGRIDLTDADGDVLVSVRYVSEIDRLRSHLEPALDGATSQKRQ